MTLTEAILQIALPTPLRRLFDYLPPEGVIVSADLLGSRVKVPLGKRSVVGILVHIRDKTDVPLTKLKRAQAILEPEPLLTPELRQLGLWLADYYHHPPGDIFLSLLPTLLRQTPKNDEAPAPSSRQHERCYQLTAAGIAAKADTTLKLTAKQRQALDLCSDETTRLSTLKQADISPAVIKRLCEKDYLREQLIPKSLEMATRESQTPPVLSEEQQHVFTQIQAEPAGFMTWVIDGVTGSGKTEIYLRLIEKVLAENKQVLVLLPEIGLTPQMIQRFEARFREPMAVMHSAISPAERLKAWLAAGSGEAKIILGTRSALFTPFKALGLIIVDEAHDLSFKQQESLRYHARDVAVKRAHLLGIPIILGSATHSLETLHAVKQGRFRYLRLQNRAGNAKPPQLQLLSIRDAVLQEGLSKPLIEAMRTHLEAGNQVLLFLNRRGFAPSLICHHCAWVAHCRQCDAKLTLHLQPRQLQCHHCERIYQVPVSCPSCLQRNLIPLGLGTVRIEQALAQLFPKYTCLRVDRDSTRGKALNETLAQIHSGKAQILIGTQMLAKGHHFPDVTLVGIIDGDSGFFSSDFRGAEYMAQTLLQVAGRAGREQKPGLVLIQTRNPEHPALQALVTDGYHAFVKMTLAERQIAALPPFQSLALLRVEGKIATAIELFLNQIRALCIKVDDSDIDILGPIPAPMPKKAGLLQFQLLFSSAARERLRQFLHQLLPAIEQLKGAQRLRWSLDVDPTALY